MEIPFQPVPPDVRRFFDWVLALPRNSSLPTRDTADKVEIVLVFTGIFL